jgi:hypothetical protein
VISQTASPVEKFECSGLEKVTFINFDFGWLAYSDLIQVGLLWRRAEHINWISTIQRPAGDFWIQFSARRHPKAIAKWQTRSLYNLPPYAYIIPVFGPLRRQMKTRSKWLEDIAPGADSMGWSDLC